MNQRQMLLGAGVAIAAWLAIFGDRTPSSEIAEPVSGDRGQRPGIRDVPTPRTDKDGKLNPDILAVRDRNQLLGADVIRPEQGTSPMFGSQSWTPPPPPAPPPAPVAPTPPPTAPPIPFTVLGKKLEAGQWEVYLTRAGMIWLVREQTEIEGMYRIDSIKPPLLSLTYLPLKQVQTLAIGASD